MQQLIDELNPSQREVALLRRHCVAVAVPGAGKTKTIATKAALLLANENARVGAVTFSKDAAVELRDRILALAGPGAKKRLLAGTFHSLAFKQLGSGGKRPGIASDGDRLALVAQVLDETGVEWRVDDAVAAIERAKTGMDAPPAGTPEALLFEAYQDALARNGKIDFQDMLRLAVAGMQRGTIKPYPFTELLVDEFQDTDTIQSRWIALHAAAGAVVSLVADDDQSIYGWRDAGGYKSIEAFIREFDATPVVLGQNYRCRAEILAAADKVIQCNKDRIPKELVAARGPGGSVAFQRFDDEYAEAVSAVEALSAVLRAGKTAAVLARTNRILDPIEAVCRSHGVRYYRASGRSILDRPEGALMGNLLELIQKSKSGGLDALLGFAGIGGHELRLIHSKIGRSMDQRQKRDLIEMGLSELSADRYRELLKRLLEWRGLCDRHLYALVLDGVHEWMMLFARSDAAKRSIRTTYDVLSRLSGPFSERLEFLRRDNNEPAEDALVLTTMHSAKGLEWSSVQIIRAEETVIPDEKSTESEERRLFYVAMTRARDQLHISTARKNPTSRFVQEADLA